MSEYVHYSLYKTVLIIYLISLISFWTIHFPILLTI